LAAASTLSVSEQQEIFRKAARDFLEKECPKSFVREMAQDRTGYTRESWLKMAGLDGFGLSRAIWRR